MKIAFAIGVTMNIKTDEEIKEIEKVFPLVARLSPESCANVIMWFANRGLRKIVLELQIKKPPLQLRSEGHSD